MGGQVDDGGATLAEPGKANPWAGRTSPKPRFAIPSWIPSTTSVATRNKVSGTRLSGAGMITVWQTGQ